MYVLQLRIPPIPLLDPFLLLNTHFSIIYNKCNCNHNQKSTFLISSIFVNLFSAQCSCYVFSKMRFSALEKALVIALFHLQNLADCKIDPLIISLLFQRALYTKKNIIWAPTKLFPVIQRLHDTVIHTQTQTRHKFNDFK